MEYGQSLSNETIKSNIEINYEGKTFDVELVFEPYQSLLYKIEDDNIEKIDISFIPETPLVKQRPEGYIAPWLMR